mgnify:CR=1 FL=1
MSKENFEESMKKLESIVTELETSNLSLDESVSKFEEGMKLSKQCNKMLEEANETITKSLTNEGTLENFDISE